VTVASASAIEARVCAAECGHFITAYALACSSQLTPGVCGPAQRAGSPVTGLKSRPRRAALMSSAR
jgi:hypothetical protein